MRPRKPTRAKQKRQTIDLSEREVRSLVKEASILAAWAVLYVPASNERIYRASTARSRRCVRVRRATRCGDHERLAPLAGRVRIVLALSYHATAGGFADEPDSTCGH